MKRYLLLILLGILLAEQAWAIPQIFEMPACTQTGYVPTYSATTGRYTCQAVSGTAANPGGTANQIQWNNSGTAFGGFTMSGDCTIVVSTGVVTCTKSGGTLLTTLFQAAGSYVSQSTTVNGHALSGNVTVTPADLSLVIGTNTEAWSANLDSWSAITTSSKQAALTLTTTGTSGAATLSAGTLNIPQYAGGGSMTWPSAAGIAVYSGSSTWGTSLTAPAGTIVGTSDSQALTNKTIAAGSNSISGLTNSNLSGSAGISNANLANASTTVNGQACTLGSTCTVADSTKVTSVSNVSAYMGGGEQSVTVSSNAATCNWGSGSTCVLTAQNNTTAWTLTMSNPVAGQVYRIYVIQGSSGPAPLPTFSPTVTWVSGSAPTFSGASTKHDAITCQYSGAMSAYFCGSIGDNF